MRVLLVTDWNPVPGGVETYVRGLRPALERAGMRVRVLTSSAGSSMDGEADVVARGSTRPSSQAVFQVFNPFAWAQMRTALREFTPDVVHVHSFAYHLSPAVVLATRDVPVVITLHDYKPICPLGTKLLPDGRHCTDRAGIVCWRHGCLSLAHWGRDQARYRLLARALARASTLLVGSAWMQRALRSEGLRTELAVYPVDAPAVHHPRRPAAAPTVLYCGRLAREKGVDVLLRAVSGLGPDLASLRALIAGDGPERHRLERLAGELGVTPQVSFLGRRTSDQVAELMSAAWAVAVPSQWAEPFGLVALEAITQGVPVVATSAGGLADLITDGVTGLTFPVGDHCALAERLSRLAAGVVFRNHVLDPDVVDPIRRSHAPDRHVSVLADIYARVIEERRGKPSVAVGFEDR
ncbi:MAG TPA: glycosyltransferase family 4 protein [Methylomirabilota bacterium]|nr:glycosyltransferase family 4 protein [Methylomirabilota bacterium]